MSLDGFIVGPNGGPDNPLGDGGPEINEWMYELESWRERAGMEGGKNNRDDDLVRRGTRMAGSASFSSSGVCSYE